jgi:Zn-finger nucleic acid-binding protein
MAKCPRCNVLLQTETYEEFETLFCNSCWGHWLTNEVFAGILKHEGYTFSSDEKTSILKMLAVKAKEPAHAEEVVMCPVCDTETEKKPFSADCPVILDLSHDHGVWLDATEIKQVQVYFDSLEK